MKLHALLIGIDHYEPNDWCDSLEGAVADVRAVEAFLLRIGVPGERIRTLTAPRGDPQARTPRDDWPTYEVMVTALRQLTARADPGDQVLIHYSGHGGRVPTIIPAAKGTWGLDEGLVPPDVDDPDARYLRDVELAYLAHEMALKGLAVTFILDCCHAGGALRGKARFVARGSRRIDRTRRPRASLVASPAELEAIWRRLYNRAYVTVRGASGRGWIAGCGGGVLVAACRCDEAAHEYPLGGQPRGLLTHCLLEILAADGGHRSFEEIQHLLTSRVHAYVPSQTPVLEGDVSRSVLGHRNAAPPRGVRVVEVDVAGRRLRLDAGQALGLSSGASLEIVSGTSGEEPQGGPIVVVEDSGALGSWAAVTGGATELSKVGPGDRAVVIDPGSGLRYSVALIEPPITAGAPTFTRAVRCKLARRATAFLELVETATEAALQATVNPLGEVVILDAGGRELELEPLSAAAPDMAERVVDRLLHLARFRAVQTLENRDPRCPLRHSLAVDLGLLPRDFKPGDPIAPWPVGPPGTRPRIQAGGWICLSIANKKSHLASQALQIYVLDLQPGWSIEQIYPLHEIETLEAGNQLRLPFRIYLPPGTAGGQETFKVLATAEPANLSWLELPPIDTVVVGSRRGAGKLEQLPFGRGLFEITRDGLLVRGPEAEKAHRLWASAQVELEVVAV